MSTGLSSQKVWWTNCLVGKWPELQPDNDWKIMQKFTKKIGFWRHCCPVGHVGHHKDLQEKQLSHTWLQALQGLGKWLWHLEAIEEGISAWPEDVAASLIMHIMYFNCSSGPPLKKEIPICWDCQPPAWQRYLLISHCYFTLTLAGLLTIRVLQWWLPLQWRSCGWCQLYTLKGLLISWFFLS